MNNGIPRIVADGPDRFRLSKAYQDARAQLLGETHQRHDEALKAAPFYRRILLHLKIVWEVRAKLQKRFPPGALHVMEGKWNEPNQSPEPTPTKYSAAAAEELLRP